jgi:hypothetical protein
MSLVYGYDLKENDDIIAAPIQVGEIMSRLLLPGAALVNHLPFCTLCYITLPALVAQGSLQCDTSLPGFHGLAMNHWRG